jgi:CheY-like chemotaxis protein
VSARAEPESRRFLRPEENLRVLLIDDDRAMLDLLAVVFSTEGYQVTAATNVHDSLTALEGAEQDVVLVDEQMLRHGNSRLCERLMIQGMPVIVLDPADPEHPAFPQATGVPTPPDVELLLALVAHFLAHPGPQRALPA